MFRQSGIEEYECNGSVPVAALCSGSDFLSFKTFEIDLCGL